MSVGMPIAPEMVPSHQEAVNEPADDDLDQAMVLEIEDNLNLVSK